MPELIKLKKGLNIRLQGKIEKIAVKAEPSETYAIYPSDFIGINPKMSVKEGDTIKAGSPVIYHKENASIVVTSPVSGTIKEIKRGDRRVLEKVVILADKEIDYLSFKTDKPENLTAENIKKLLLESGLWLSIKQRPYNIIANPELNPKAVFISGFDTAPLAPDVDFQLTGLENELQTGINVIKKLTNAPIHLSLDGSYPPSRVYKNLKNVEFHYFIGKHPAGNVGIQIHHIDPINKGDIVWTFKPQDLVIIGRFFEKGIYDPSIVIGLNGSEVLRPRYFKILKGACINNLVKDNVTDGENRYIRGNVLTGKQTCAEGHVGYFDSIITVIPEGKKSEFVGWASPGFKKFSFYRTFWSWIAPGKLYKENTNLHGGHRAYVFTGQFEKVLPMDVYPLQLIKAILAEDIELMENLGIYEVVEEDFALCEYIDVSKTDIQSIIRKGIDMMIKELG